MMTVVIIKMRVLKIIRREFVCKGRNRSRTNQNISQSSAWRTQWWELLLSTTEEDSGSFSSTVTTTGFPLEAPTPVQDKKKRKRRRTFEQHLGNKLFSWNNNLLWLVWRLDGRTWKDFCLFVCLNNVIYWYSMHVVGQSSSGSPGCFLFAVFPSWFQASANLWQRVASLWTWVTHSPLCVHFYHNDFEAFSCLCSVNPLHDHKHLHGRPSEQFHYN